MARTGRPETPIRYRFLEKIAFDALTGCWIWTGARHSQGYGLIKRKDGKQLRAHRAAYEWVFGPIPPGLQVCHRCDNPRCVRPGHLFLGTPRDNAADMVAKGRAARNVGERNGAARLTQAQVAQIRATSQPYCRLAETFGVTPSAIGLIKRHERWTHV